MRSVAALRKVFILSPHLDDAIFGCGELIAKKGDVTVITLFAGIPPAGFDRLTPWDAAAGFHTAQEAVGQRRAEDRRALDLLYATPLWLDFYDSQYGHSPTVETLAAALIEILQAKDPDTVLMPAGLFHSDHILAHRAALMARQQCAGRHWFLYEDAFYRRMPGQLQHRLIALAEAHILATPIAFDTRGQSGRKHHAAHCYRSQLRALSTHNRQGYADLSAPEGYWWLVPMPAAPTDNHAA